MTNRAILIIFFLLISFTNVMTASEINEKNEIGEEKVIFLDENLEESISEELDIPIGEITVENIASLEELDAIGKNITNLSGLEYAVNLKKLNLFQNEITDISPLINLVKLEELNLAHNNIKDISFLKELKELKYLDLYDNDIVDISLLGELSNLEHLDLRENSITNISSLKNVNNLKYLDLKKQNINLYNDVCSTNYIEITDLDGVIHTIEISLSDSYIWEIPVIVGGASTTFSGFVENYNCESSKFSEVNSLHTNTNEDSTSKANKLGKYIFSGLMLIILFVSVKKKGRNEKF